MTRGRASRFVAFAALVAFAAAGLAVWISSRFRVDLRREAGLDVLLITIDTLRSDALGAYGQARPTSPWIDRLSQDGVRFETAHAHNVMTLPSHANILSGRHPFEHGVRDNAGFRFPEHLDSLATILKRQGYRTAAFVSSFTLDSRFGLDRGFDVYEDSFVARQAASLPRIPERPAAATVALASEWLRTPGAGPRFAWVHLYDPHAPYQPPEPQASSFRADPYLGEVAATDAALRALLEPVLAAGRRGRTLLVLTADHGEALGEHGERAHGLFGYEATLRVPLVVYAPRLLDPRVVREPVRHVDVAPTILDALGVAVPADWPGRSLLGLAAGQRAPAAASYFEALSAMLGRGWAPLYGVVHEGWKYVELPEPELYELGPDRRELRNLVASRPEAVERLRGRLARFREQDGGPAPREESADTRQRLAALGYVTAVLAPPRRHYTAADDPKRLVHLDDMMQQVIARERGGDREGAVSLCAEVVRQRPDMVSALLVLARLERSRGRLDAAIRLLERANAANPDDASAPAMLAAYLGEAGRAAEALRRLDPYVRRAEPPLDALQAQGVALARLGRSQEALAVFDRVRRRDPDSPVLLVQMATVHLERGEAARAAAYLEEALRLNPDLGLAHHHLGLLRLAGGDAAGAERHLRRALELEPTDVDSQLNLGLLLARQGRAQEARPLLEEFVRGAPRSIYGAQIGRVLALLSQPPLASTPRPR